MTNKSLHVFSAIFVLSATDCQWGEWELVGECSKTCGGGVQKQKRDKLVFEKNGGACSDASPDQMESVDCNTEPCKQFLEGFTLFQLPRGILLFHNQIC